MQHIVLPVFRDDREADRLEKGYGRALLRQLPR